MRSTGLEMAKNQGLDSVHQNKKIKIKNFERRQRRDMLTYRGGGGSAKGYKIKRFAKGYIFLKYVPIYDVSRQGRPTGRPTPPATTDGPATGDAWRHGRHWRPIPPTQMTRPTLAAAGRRTSNHQQGTPATDQHQRQGQQSTSGKDWPKGDNNIIRQIIIYNIIKSVIIRFLENF